jgi:hypothetical protein
MSKVFPDFQTFLDTRDGDTVGVTKVTMTAVVNHFNLPKSTDARVLAGSLADQATIPNFYLNTNQNRFSMDGVTSDIGKKFTVVSRHRGSLNFNDEGSS